MDTLTPLLILAAKRAAEEREIVVGGAVLGGCVWGAVVWTGCGGWVGGAAQEFLNENRSADLSRVKCLLHKLLPKEYFEYIEQLREHQDPQTIINIMGGQNIVAPNAQEASQSFHGERKSKKGS